MSVSAEVENVALGRPTIQSTDSIDSNKAVDGNDSPNYAPAWSCTETQWGTNPYWGVQLDQVYPIDNVVITNRADCCRK